MVSITTWINVLLILPTFGEAIGRQQTSWVTIQSHRKLKPIAGRVSLLKTFSTHRQLSTEAENDAINSIFDDIAMNTKNQSDDEEHELSQYYRLDPDDDPNRPIPDKEGLRELLFQRFEARRNFVYDTVQQIDTVLRKTHGVRAYDNPNFWTTQSRPPRSYLRRSVSKTAAKMKTHFGPTGHSYDQVGQGIDQVTCPLTLTEIHSLLSRRCQSRLQGKYEEADAVRFDMELNGLHAHDGLMQWRADGQKRFDESEKTSEQISEPEQPFIEDLKSKNDTDTDGKVFRRVEFLMKMRAEALARGETIISDVLSLELYKTYGVVVDDNLRSWSYVVADAIDNERQPPELPDKNVSLCITKDLFPPTMFANEEQRYASPAYRQSENSRNVPNDLARQRIEQLVQERIHKRDERKFFESDSIRRELWETYHVGVSDRLRQWSVAGVLDSDQEHIPHSYYSQKEGSSCLLPDQQEEVENLLRYLESTRKGQNKNVEDPILQRLRGVHGVEVDDERMEWYYVGVATEGDGIYRPRRELSGVPQKTIEVIQGLVDRRQKELQKGKKQVADTIAEGLWRKYQVIIDDNKHQWEVDT
jgi:cysteinyl-tRNA synthetase